MLTTTELAQMRADLLQMLPDTCVIYSATQAVDAQGAISKTWAASGTAACRLDAPRNVSQDGMQISGAALQAFRRYTLTLPYDTTIVEGQRVVHGGETYTATNVDTDKSWPVSRRVFLERVP